MASILVIDDSDLVQSVVSIALVSQGHEVTSAKDMRDGLKQLRRANYDLILMDLNMPGVRGEAGIRLLRQRLGLKTPIIILSGEITTDTIREMKPLDVAGYVAKGDDFEAKLCEEVANVLWFKEY